MTFSTVICAIDPGLTGSIAFLTPGDTRSASVHDMPRVGDLVEPIELERLILANRATVGVIEQVAPMPSQAKVPGGERRDMGAKSAFAFGAAFATARTVLMLSAMPLHPVVPTKWKAAMGLRGGADAKETARQKAIELFPHLQPDLKRKKDHNRAEALLLALYCADVILNRREVA